MEFCHNNVKQECYYLCHYRSQRRYSSRLKCSVHYDIGQVNLKYSKHKTEVFCFLVVTSPILLNISQFNDPQTALKPLHFTCLHLNDHVNASALFFFEIFPPKQSCKCELCSLSLNFQYVFFLKMFILWRGLFYTVTCICFTFSFGIHYVFLHWFNCDNFTSKS